MSTKNSSDQVPQFDTQLAGEIGIRRSQCSNFREGMSMNNTKNTSSVQVSKQPQVENFDLLILGGGTGSTIAAWTFTGEGMRVAAIDRKYIGGSCPNIACLPSKNIIHSAKVASYFRRSREFGIVHDGFTD
jgi:hypothetical protein